MRRMNSIAVASLVLVPIVGGWCDTKAENTPLEAAKFDTPKPIVDPQVQISPEPPEPLPAEVSIANQRWAPTATEYQLPERMLEPVGAAAGLRFYAFAWDQFPYDRLLVPVPPAAPAELVASDPAYGPLRVPGGPPSWRVFQQVY